MRFIEHRTTRVIASVALLGSLAFVAPAIRRVVVTDGTEQASAHGALSPNEMAALLGGACPGCAQTSDMMTCMGVDACTVCTGSQDGSDPPACAVLGDQFTNNAIPTQGDGDPMMMNKPSPVVVNCSYIDYNCNLNDPAAQQFTVCEMGNCAPTGFPNDKCRDCTAGTVDTQPIQMDGTFCAPCGT